MLRLLTRIVDALHHEDAVELLKIVLDGFDPARVESINLLSKISKQRKTVLL